MRALLLAALTALTPVSAWAADAQALLRQARAALGPEPKGMLRLEHEGVLYAREQAHDPDEVFAPAGRRYRWWFDVEGGRVRREAEQLFPGGIRFSYIAALRPDGGFNVDALRWRNGDDLDLSDQKAALASRLPFERFAPQLVLRQAAASDALQAVDGDTLRYRDAAGSLIEVDLEPGGGRVVRVAQIGDADRVAAETLFRDYAVRSGVLAPSRLVIRTGDGQVREALELVKAGVSRVDSALFQPPAGYRVPPAAGEPALRSLAAGLWFFENMPGDYHAMVADMGDHLVLIEAPLSPAYAAAQKALIERNLPGKPVRYVLVTHPHGDHVGGLAAWAAEGAVAVAALGAGVALRRQLARSAQPVLVEEVQESRSFGAGPSRLEVHAFESSHAEAHLLIHAPEPDLIFQGDLFYLPERGEPPAAFPVVGDLQRELRRLQITPELIVGVHGRPATAAQMQESLRRAQAD